MLQRQLLFAISLGITLHGGASAEMPVRECPSVFAQEALINPSLWEGPRVFSKSVTYATIRLVRPLTSVSLATLLMWNTTVLAHQNFAQQAEGPQDATQKKEQNQTDKKTVILGTVHDSANTALAGVRATLLGPINSPIPIPSKDLPVDISAPDGTFTLEKVLTPGLYIVQLEKAGFPTTQSRMITVTSENAGKPISISVVMILMASASGRVMTDDDDKGLPNIEIEFFRASYIQGQLLLKPAGKTITGVNGDWSMETLQPDNYYAYVHSVSREPQTIRTFYPIFFSKAETFDAAVAMPFLSGAHETFDIRVHLVDGYAVVGRVTNPTEPSYSVELLQGDGDLGPVAAQTVTDKDGNYSFPKAANGVYTVRIYPRGLSKRFVVSQRTIEVKGTDVTADLPAPEALTLHGQIGFATKQGTLPDLQGIEITYQKIGFSDNIFFSPGQVDIASNGSFDIPNLGPGKFLLTARRLPENYSIQGLDGFDSPNLVLTMAPSKNIGITLQTPAATLSGTVRDAGDNAITQVARVLVRAHSTPGALLYMTSTDKKGRFTLKNIPPGEYDVYPWNLDSLPHLYQDTRFLDSLTGSTVVTAAPGTNEIKVPIIKTVIGILKFPSFLDGPWFKRHEGYTRRTLTAA